ncbi:MAG TPA: CerR family C-terminal domain-containing protein, partial [Vicinamibacterales bacterium]|nr:CerR family C-terminal domain-containing protein [Vicinamibacterales bacterium]
MREVTARRVPAPRARRTPARATAPVPDRETRARLLDEARKLFAAQGFRRVTVREICTAARANVAAINYHFGGKRGLYREVLDAAIAVMQESTERARAAGEGGTSEQKLRAFIRAFMHRLGQVKDPWIHQMMTHEMAEPTDALDEVVRRVMVPRIDYLRDLVADILGVEAADDRVLRCVLSVQSQFHAAMANPVSRRLVPGFTGDPESVDRLAQHIADFSIGGIRSLRERPGA